MEVLSELMFLPVMRGDGRCLGHVDDVRVRTFTGPDGPEAVIDELVYGRRGFLESMGLREPHVDSVRWDQVREVRDGRIILK